MDQPKFQILTILLPVMCLLCGCMHYNTGINSEVPFSKIYIAPVKNDTAAHHIRATLGAQIRQKIAHHPRITLLNDEKSADVCLTVKIKNFDQSLATTSPNDSVQARSFTLKASVECSLFDNRTQKYLFKNHTISTLIDVQSDKDYLWNKTKSLPQLSDKLADKIYDIVCKPW